MMTKRSHFSPSFPLPRLCRIKQLEEQGARRRLDQGELGNEVGVQRRARERAEERLKAKAHDIEALRASSERTRL
jgi:hypothetical protein